MSEIEYKEIKSKDITTLSSLSLNTSRGVTKTANNQGNLWTTLVGFLDSEVDWKALEGLKDSAPDGIDPGDLILETLKKVLHTAFLKELQETKISWTVDERTKAACKYLSDIKKIVMFGVTGSLVPGDNTVGARCGVLKLCKVEKTSLERMKDSVDTLVKHSKKIEKQEAKAALELYNLLSEEVTRLNSLV